jgi:hypothetical protein
LAFFGFFAACFGVTTVMLDMIASDQSCNNIRRTNVDFALYIMTVCSLTIKLRRQ